MRIRNLKETFAARYPQISQDFIDYSMLDSGANINEDRQMLAAEYPGFTWERIGEGYEEQAPVLDLAQDEALTRLTAMYLRDIGAVEEEEI